MAYGLNPNYRYDAGYDPDNDGLTNLQEYQYLTDPHNPDTDGDGYDDGYEVSHGMNPRNPSDFPGSAPEIFSIITTKSTIPNDGSAYSVIRANVGDIQGH